MHLKWISALAVLPVVAAIALLAPQVALGYTSTGTSYPLIVVDKGPGSQSDPHLSGTVAAYADDAARQIEYFDFSTNATSSIPKPVNAADSLPDVSGDAIVFTRLSSTGQAIYLHFLLGGSLPRGLVDKEERT